MRRAGRVGTRKHSLPLGVWVKTAVIVALVVAATTAYDLYYRHTNPYIRVVEQRIARFDHSRDKPLVVAVGASLMMLGTPRDWPDAEYDWLRLIIQGSRLDDFETVTDDIVRLEPDLIVLDLHQFIDKPYSVHLRQAFKRLLRAPLEAYGLIRRRSQFEHEGCSGGGDLDTALDRVSKQFESPGDEISSSMLDEYSERGIPVVIVRVPMIAEIEAKVDERNEWLKAIQRDARARELQILDTGWRNLDASHFCADHVHMNGNGERVFSAWLESRIEARLESLE